MRRKTPNHPADIAACFWWQVRAAANRVRAKDFQLALIRRIADMGLLRFALKSANSCALLKDICPAPRESPATAILLFDGE